MEPLTKLEIGDLVKLIVKRGGLLPEGVKGRIVKVSQSVKENWGWSKYTYGIEWEKYGYVSWFANHELQLLEKRKKCKCCGSVLNIGKDKL